MRLIVLGHNDWWVWERQGFSMRNAALVCELSRRAEVDGVAVVDDPRFGRRTHRPRDRRAEPVSAVADKVRAVRYAAPLPLPAKARTGRRVNERLARPALARRLRAALAGWAGPTVVWVADPRLMAAGLALPRDLLVFDAIDDWRAHAWAGRATVEEGYRLAALHADVVFAVHPSLLEWIEPHGRAEFLPNAVDPARWAGAEPAPELTSLPRPLAGYAGTIQGRLDVALLGAVAAALPDATFALVGRVGRAVEGALAALPRNVRLLPPVRHDALPPVVAACDAGIVPHVHDALTASMDPLKLYEYLAAGLPVVSTVASPNPALGGEVRIARDAEAFAAALREELSADDPERRAARRRTVAGETWAARADRVLTVLDEALRARSVTHP